MNEHVVSEGQNIIDIAIMKSGTIDGVFDIIEANEGVDLESRLPPGKKILIPEEFAVESKETKQFFEQKYKTQVATSDETTEALWILRNGCWDDKGVWVDHEKWNDWCDRWILENGWWDDGKMWEDSAIWNDG